MLRGALVRLGALVALSFVARLHLFLSSAEPTGWDGYAWVIQVQRLVAEGQLHWADASWVTYFLGALHVVVPSPIIAVKLGACVLAALVVPAAWRLGGWPLALWAALSPTLTHLAGDFPKSLALVAPLFLALSSRKVAHAVVFALIAALAHRLGAVFVGVAAVGALAGQLTLTWQVRRFVIVGVVTAVLFAAASAFLPGLLHPQDLERVEGQFSSPHLLPWPYFSLRETTWPQRLELLVGWPAVVVGVSRFLKEPGERARTAALLAPLVVCVFPFWRHDVLDLGYRLSLFTPCFAAPILLRHFKLNRFLVVALLLVTTPLARSGFDVSSTPPYARWRALIDRIPRPLPPLLITPTGFNFFYDFVTGHDALAWSPEAAIARETTWRLAWGLTDGEWLEFAEGLSPPPQRLDASVVYVREDVWEVVRTRALQDPDEDLHARINDARNPSRVRPASMLRNR